MVRKLDQVLAALLLFDLPGARKKRIKIAKVVDQKRRCFDANARHAGHVVGRIADERLHLDDFVGRHAEFLDHALFADHLVLHGVVHDNARLDDLHEVLV